MIFIEHRKNRINDLAHVESQNGVEIDFRTQGRSLILSHDVFEVGDDFGQWLWEHQRQQIKGPIILNTKEDGLEDTILQYFTQLGIKSFYFLDTAIPTLRKFIEKGMGKHFMVRLSTYEPLEQALLYKDEVEWLWVDCFKGALPEAKVLEKASQHFKLCMVSPELQGLSLKENINNFSQVLRFFSAICTKDPKFWQAVVGSN